MGARRTRESLIQWNGTESWRLGSFGEAVPRWRWLGLESSVETQVKVEVREERGVNVEVRLKASLEATLAGWTLGCRKGLLPPRCAAVWNAQRDHVVLAVQCSEPLTQSRGLLQSPGDQFRDIWTSRRGVPSSCRLR